MALDGVSHPACIGVVVSVVLVLLGHCDFSPTEGARQQHVGAATEQLPKDGIRLRSPSSPPTAAHLECFGL